MSKAFLTRPILAGSMLLTLGLAALILLVRGEGIRARRPGLEGVWQNSEHSDTAAEGITGPGFAFDPVGLGGVRRNTFLKPDDRPAPMTPWALERFKAHSEGVGIKEETADPNTLEPRKSCFPPGPSDLFAMTMPFPFEIVQREHEVVLLFEWDHWVRRVYLNERTHPDGYPTTWMGHSIGRYEGQTLVVDTVGMNDRTWLDDLGHPHTDALHLVERFNLLDGDTLQIELRFEDPQVYTKPWTGRKVLKRMPRGYRIMEHVVCEEYLELGKHR